MIKEIYTRRSIRSYNEQSIPNEILKNIIKAGMNAPSAHNLKQYEFIVVKNYDTLQKLGFVTKYSLMVKECNCCIVVASGESNDFWQLDLGATIENMLLEAEHNGIGSCWIGIGKENEKMVKAICQIPANLRVISMISLGYPKKEKKQIIIIMKKKFIMKLIKC